MRHALLFSALVALSACGGADPAAVAGDAAPEAPAAAPASEGARSDVSIAEFKPIHDSGSAQIVDVRTQGEWDQGHVPNAIHVPLSDLSPDHPAIEKLDKSEDIYFICASGNRSSRASDAMAKAGFRAVNVQGGTSGWVSAGHAVE